MKIATTLFFLSGTFASIAQLNVIPYAGISSPQMKLRDEMQNGGNSAMAGLEIEWRTRSSDQGGGFITVATGIGYRKDDFSYVSTLSQSFHDSEDYYYTREALHIQNVFWQVPLMVKIHIQPFPLLEEYHLFCGVGMTHNFRKRANISEEYTGISPPNNESLYIETGPLTENFAYFHDTSQLGNKYSLFGRVELGMQYNRLHLSFRLSRSLTDTYFEGLESIPDLTRETNGVPNWAYSMYVTSYQSNLQKLKEVHREMIVGFRLFR